MKKVLAVLSLVGVIQLSAQSTNPITIAKNCYEFLSNQENVKFENQASMDEDLDTVHITEHYYSITKIKNHKKIKYNIFDGQKHASVYFNGEQLTLMSVTDEFYSVYKVSGGIKEARDFASDSLNYDFPLLTLFEKKTAEELFKLKPISYYAGLKFFKGKKVHHLVFKLKEFSWQMFVSADESRPVPYKIIINDYQLKTTYSAELFNWDFSEIPDNQFSVKTGNFVKLN